MLILSTFIIMTSFMLTSRVTMTMGDRGCSTIRGCDVCTNPPLLCAACEDGYGRHWDRHKCVACGPHCLSCEVQRNSHNHDVMVCHQCEDKFFLYITENSTECKRCPAHCASCSSEHDCDICDSGYSNSGLAVQCPACPDSCIVCHDEKTCLQCADGFFLLNGHCQNCMNNCLNCSSPYNCFNCQHGTTWVNDQCLPCALPNCPRCDPSQDPSIPICTQCNERFYLSQGTPPQCMECIDDCLRCADDSSCLECQDGFYLETGLRTCTQCLMKCDLCSDSLNCFQCSTGYYWTGYSCERCSVSFCEMCDNGSMTCSKCVGGHFFDPVTAKCKGCYSAMRNCLQCNSSTHCEVCVQKQYFNPITVSCRRCGANCNRCAYDVMTGGAICTQCQDGYCWDPQLHACREWPYNNLCTECTEVHDGLTCVDCLVSDHAMFLQVCQACSVVNCDRCATDVTICDHCIRGMIYNTQTGHCQECPGWPNCLSCDSTLRCDVCHDGYFGDYCDACPSFCTSCTSSSDCDGCLADDYYWDTDTLHCEPCGYLCAFCSSPLVCDECELRSIRDPNNPSQCDACPDGCELCEWNTMKHRMICTMCETGYYITQYDTCRYCSSSFPLCTLCDDFDLDGEITAKECIDCSPGHFNNERTQCLACPLEGCTECIHTPQTCHTCKRSYDFNEGTCHLKGEECFVYDCKGDCPETYNPDQVELCPHLGQTQGCWTLRTESPSGAVQFSRGCKNLTCNHVNREQYCNVIDGNRVCGICCDHHHCNTHQLYSEAALLINAAPSSIINQFSIRVYIFLHLIWLCTLLIDSYFYT